MPHEPVMVPEVVSLLEPSRGGLFVDCTVGMGGHARALVSNWKRAVFPEEGNPMRPALSMADLHILAR